MIATLACLAFLALLLAPVIIGGVLEARADRSDGSHIVTGFAACVVWWPIVLGFALPA